MPNPTTRDVVGTRTADVIEATLEMCCTTRDNLAQSEMVVLLSRQTIASSIALLSRIRGAASSD